MPDSLTMEMLAGIIVAAIGGNEGVKHLIRTRKQRNGNGYVSKEFCNERTSNLKETIEDIQADVKTIIRTLHTP
jgi:hypothetical protein